MPSFFDIDGQPVDGLFGELIKPLFGGPQRRPPPKMHPAMPRFEGRQIPMDVQLAAVRRRDERIAKANALPAEPGLVARAVETAIAAVVEIVAPTRPKEISRALALLNSTLSYGPVPEKKVRELAASNAISPRTLRRAKKLAKVKSVRNSDRSANWCLPEAAS